MKRHSFILMTTGAALSFTLAFGPVSADSDRHDHGDHGRRYAIINAEPATGPNRILDKPVRDHGVVFGVPLRTLGFSELGVYNPGGQEALPLTGDTDPDAILATFLDPAFVKAIGFNPDDLDPSFLNVPLQQVKTLSETRTPTGVVVSRESLPGMFESQPFAPSIAAPTKPISLKDWISARGRAVIKCHRNGNATVTLRMRNLIPNRLYTVWTANVSAELGPFNQPLGGAPSAFATDEEGNGRFKRRINFCPLEPVHEVQAQMLWLMVLLHSDHMAYGGVFTTNEDSLFGGTVAHVQLHFPITGEPVE